jgi:hypothetical protein
MPALFISDLKPWVKEIFRNRERVTESSIFKVPFVILTSPALVTKQSSDTKLTLKERAEKFQDIINNTFEASSMDSYKGCIITNKIQNKDNSYQLGPSHIGVDFRGNRINVDGETNRAIPNPIIESLQIDTDGTGNTLKIATVGVRLFSLKQLEMFELFYLKPGMNLLLEFGNNQSIFADIRRDYIKNRYGENSEKTQTEGAQSVINLQKILVDKSNYDSFCSNFSELSIGDMKALQKYYKRVEDSRGTYEQVAGKVLDYTYSIEENGTYVVVLKITAGNEVSRAIPKATTTASGKTKGTSVKPDDFNTWINQIEVDFGLPQLSEVVAKSNDSKYFFNWGVANADKGYESLSKKPYITLGFVIDKILNHNVLVNAGFIDDALVGIGKQKFYTDANGGGEMEMILANSAEALISSNENVIFPGQLPSFIKDKTENTIVLKTDKNGNIETTDCSINDLEYTIKNSTLFVENEKKHDTSPEEVKDYIQVYSKDGDDIKLGNALNIFINYEAVLSLWRKAYTMLDFLEGILDVVNDNSYGLIKLILGTIEGGKFPAFIVDGKLRQDKKTLQGIMTSVDPAYRFRPTTISSIVKEFTYDFNMSENVAGRTLFNSYAYIAQTKAGKNPDNEQLLGIQKDAYESIDFYRTQNADGWYSLNYVDIKSVEKQQAKAQNNNGLEQSTGTKSKTQEDVSKVIDASSKKFKTNNGTKILIFQNEKVVSRYVAKSFYEKNKSLLTPIEISITIDGISGISCGEYFKCDGVPEIHNVIGAFQIENVKHSVTPDGWYTTLDARWRVLDIDK